MLPDADLALAGPEDEDAPPDPLDEEAEPDPVEAFYREVDYWYDYYHDR
ncbi:MAG: hypothetical protein KKB13_04160 [Chloroflexi bacterium]|nr:hypothetical protein [Chloroflexota bacterium]